MTPEELKSLVAPYRRALADFDPSDVARAIGDVVHPEARISMCHPFGDLAGGAAFQHACLDRLHAAMPDLERRDMIVMAGTTPEGQDWCGTMGNYMGTFLAPFLDIPPTGHLAHMRYHEFFRIEDGKVVEMQAIWDIPELMMQARAWPMAPQLGAFLCTPAPMSGNGLNVTGDGKAAMDHVVAMLTDLCRHPAEGGPEVMNLEKYWHPACNWYGPAGIGTGRGLSGFRHWHQIPFLRGMPDRKLDAMGDLMSHWVGEGQYVCETGWPNMRLTVTGDGWMGIAPSGAEILLRSLDFWRLEGGLIRENWVLVDLLDAYRQLGVDVFARMREFNKARVPGNVPLPDWENPMTLPTTPSFRLDGKRALVAGASSGIGEACAVALAEAGAEVMLAARRKDRLESLATELASAGHTAHVLEMDVADIPATEAAVAELGPFDILVNSAGLARHGPALDTTEPDFDAVSTLNLKGAYFLTRAVAKGLIAVGKPGSLINISSQMAHVGGIERAVYCGTKHGVEGFTKAFAIEWGGHGIRVNTICPTFIRTDLTASTFENPERAKWISEKIKLGRVGEVEDIMGPVVFLASDAAALITGTSLLVDGGWTAD